MNKEQTRKLIFQNLVKLFVLFLGLFGINCLLYEKSYSQTNLEDEIKLNRSLAFQNNSTQVPYIFFEIRDTKGNSVHCVTFPGREVISHGRVKENEIVIVVNDINSILDDLKYEIVNKDILAKSLFAKMNRNQLIEEYFLNGAIKEKYADLARSREFIFCLLRNGLFVRSGCESSLELYIGRP